MAMDMDETHQAGQGPISVLLVDDEEYILTSLRRLLMDEKDVDVVTAGSGEEGLELLPELVNLGVIVSDQRMPGMSGAEFLEKARLVRPDAVRIILTGYADVSAAVDAINRGGAWRYLTKPWNNEELAQTIRDAVELYIRESQTRRLNDIIRQQNSEMETWTENLKKRLLQSTTTIREQSHTLRQLSLKKPVAVVFQAFDGFLEVMGGKHAVHARTVSSLVADVARRMGLDAETITRFRLAALLHDVGKFGTLSAELNKGVEDMSESEAGEYRRHPLRGEEMVSRVEELADVALMVRSHHETFDGQGFPDGLESERIPLGARLIAIADLIERSARSVEKHRADFALMTARFHGGTLLDPHLVTKFQGITRAIYFEGRKSGLASELELEPRDLIPGMQITRDVESGTGVLLMQRGTVLDMAGILLIRGHFHKTPTPHGIFVQVTSD